MATPRGWTCCAWPAPAQARVFVLAIDDVEQSVEVARWCASISRSLTVVARARNVHALLSGCANVGVTLIERETFDSALMSARSVLEAMGWQPHQARNQALRFRRHNIDLLEQTAPHWRRGQADRIGQARPPAAGTTVRARA